MKTFHGGFDISVSLQFRLIITLLPFYLLETRFSLNELQQFENYNQIQATNLILHYIIIISKVIFSYKYF